MTDPHPGIEGDFPDEPILMATFAHRTSQIENQIENQVNK